MSLPARGVLLVTIGSTSGSKNIGRSRVEQRVERLAGAQRKRRARRAGRVRRGGESASGVHVEHELARGEVVVGAGVDPEQLRVALDLRERRGVDAVRVRDDRLEHIAHLEVVRVALVVVDVAAGDRRLVRDARPASSRAAPDRRSRPHTAARPPHRRRARADTCGRPARPYLQARSSPSVDVRTGVRFSRPRSRVRPNRDTDPIESLQRYNSTVSVIARDVHRPLHLARDARRSASSATGSP